MATTRQQFEQFVEAQAKSRSTESEHRFDWDAERATWLSRLNDLHATIEMYLEKEIHSGGVAIKKSCLRLNEETLGAYEAPVMSIQIAGKQIVELRPIGRIIIGAHGRVDMMGPHAKARLLLVPKQVKEPKFIVQISVGGREEVGQEIAPATQADDEIVWKFASFPPHVTYDDLNEETFLDMLMKCAGA